MISDALKKAQLKYNTEKTRQVCLRLNISGDADIMAKLDSVPSKQGYIKALIRADMARAVHPAE